MKITSIITNKHTIAPMIRIIDDKGNDLTAIYAIISYNTITKEAMLCEKIKIDNGKIRFKKTTDGLHPFYESKVLENSHIEFLDIKKDD